MKLVSSTAYIVFTHSMVSIRRHERRQPHTCSWQGFLFHRYTGQILFCLSGATVALEIYSGKLQRKNPNLSSSQILGLIRKKKHTLSQRFKKKCQGFYYFCFCSDNWRMINWAVQKFLFEFRSHLWFSFFLLAMEESCFTFLKHLLVSRISTASVHM